MHAAQAALTLRQITGLTYQPFHEKSGGYDLKANLAYPVSARDPSTVYLTRSIVPSQNRTAPTHPSSPGQNSAQNRYGNPDTKANLVKSQIVSQPQNTANVKLGRGIEGNLHLQTPNPATEISQKSLPQTAILPQRNAPDNVAPLGHPPATRQNQRQADLPLPVGRAELPVFAPQFQAGTGKAIHLTSSAQSGQSGNDLGNNTDKNLPTNSINDKNFVVTGPVSTYVAGNVLANSGLVAGVNNVSQSSRIGLIVDRLAG
ncbi:MAG: hypothetical protein ORN98_01380 [Alphaproteobacteria bacterium]|nr:hypothetical protein [Alphaproteobacteria bacterium]